MAHYNDNSRPLASPTEEQVDELASLYSSYHHHPYSQQQHATPHDPYSHRQHNPHLGYAQYQTVSHQVQQSQHAQQPTYTPVQGNAILPSTHSPAYSSDVYAPFLSSTSDSGTSGPSALSSRIPSPALHNVHDWSNHHFAMGLGVLDKDRYPSDRVYDMMDPDNLAELGKIASGVDPALIEPQYSMPAPHQTQYATSQSPNPAYMYSVSPPLSQGSLPSHGSLPSSGTGPIRSEQKAPRTWQPYDTHRSQSVLSDHSHHSAASCTSDDKKEVCPIDGCNREVRDLKAHLLTHQSQRPEKCPIASCPYHLKGFSRKYDKNRHTLTHFKGTMVCDFCTGAGTAHEKTFNRTDVFKRHLQAVHGVEQSATAARKKSASSTRSSTSTESMGLCRTCGRQFASAQALYDHIDDCALQSVQQEDPSEAINLANLSSVSDDPDVLRTLELLNLPTTLNGPVSFPDLSADFGSPPPAPDDQH